jgi:hypothetical protein
MRKSGVFRCCEALLHSKSYACVILIISLFLQDSTRIALREKQIREQLYAHLNGIKIHNQWRKIMRMAKVEELRKEIEILSQNHEREVDRKDAIIQVCDTGQEYNMDLVLGPLLLE